MMHNLKIILKIFYEHQFVTTTEADVVISSIQIKVADSSLTAGGAGADPGFLERGSICIKEWGFALLILSNFS